MLAGQSTPVLRTRTPNNHDAQLFSVLLPPPLILGGRVALDVLIGITNLR